MADPLAGLGGDDIAPAETPATDPAGIEARLKAEFERQINERVAGLQRVISDKDKALAAAQSRARELEMSGMSQDEKDAAEWQQLQQGNEALRRENELLRLGRDFPDEVPIYQQMLEAPDFKSNLELIRTLRKQQAQAAIQSQTPEADAGFDVPDIDPNNPPSSLPAGTSPGGVEMTDDLATQILSRIKRLR